MANIKTEATTRYTAGPHRAAREGCRRERGLPGRDRAGLQLVLPGCPDCRARPDAGLLVNAQGRARGGVTRRHSAGVLDVQN